MNPYEVEALVEKAAALMTQFERRGRELEQRQQALAVEVPVLVKQSVDTVLQTLPRQVQGVVHGALEQTTRTYEQRLGEAGARAHVLAQQIERLERVHRHVVWKTFGVAACALVALTVGGGLLAKHYFDKMQENRLKAELLQAYNAADVAPCGKGQLCANVDLKGPRFGDQKQYRPIKPRN